MKPPDGGTDSLSEGNNHPGDNREKAKPSAIDAVLFDLDGTLVEYRRSTEQLLAESFEAVGTDPLFPPAAYYERFDEFLGDYQDMGAFRAACFAEAATAHGADPDLAREVAMVFERKRDQSAVISLEGVPTVLHELADRYQLGLVTNGPEATQRTKLNAVGLQNTFEVMVFAGFQTRTKPAIEPFEEALNDLGVAPNAAVHVGDSVASDVAGANAAGIYSVHFNPSDATPPDNVRPDHVIDSLTELVEPPWEGND